MCVLSIARTRNKPVPVTYADVTTDPPDCTNHDTSEILRGLRWDGETLQRARGLPAFLVRTCIHIITRFQPYSCNSPTTVLAWVWVSTQTFC